MPVDLALDIATQTGACWDAEDGRPRFVTFRTPSPIRGEGGADFGPTFLAFDRWLTGHIAVTKPRRIAFEAPMQVVGFGASTRPTSQQTVRLLMGLASIAELVAAKAEIPTYELNISTAKKHFAGSGRADKAAMMARCKQLGWPVRTDHEADAGAVWSCLKATTDKSWRLPTFQLFQQGR